VSDPEDPTRKLLGLWSHAARGSLEAVQAFWGAAIPKAPVDPAAAAAQVGEAWSGWLQGWFDGAPEELARAWSGKLFNQPGTGPQTWADGFARQLSGFLTPGAAPDSDRLNSLWNTAWSEYLADLDVLPEGAFTVDFGPISAAWHAIQQGSADPEQRAMVGRLLEALSVKARLGPEYYADPSQVAVAPTPRTLHWSHERIELYRYDGGTAGDRPPVLIVYSVINKSYILDLCEGSSFVQNLLDQGLDVWMIEWNGAIQGDRETTLDDYIERGIGGCVERIVQATGRESVSLFGHCIGGTLSAMYAALHPERVARFLLLTAPFQTPKRGVVALATDPSVFDVDAIVDQHGHMPAKLIRYTFLALKPWFELMKWKMFIEGLGDAAVMDRFAVIDKWANDNVDIPGEVFRKYVDEVFHSGRLLNGETEIDGRRVDLGAIDCPTWNLAGTSDWIVPPDCARPFSDRASGEAVFEELPGSHLTVILDPRQRPMWDRMAEFLRGEESTA
jgi:polyhydroxyalkanoate synthase subunit PhaC